MCENPEPRNVGGFRSDTIAPTESAWESVGNPPPEEHDQARAGRLFGKPEDATGEHDPLYEVFAGPHGSTDVAVRIVRCEWFARCTNDATHVVAHPAFKSGVPACNDHGV